MVTDFLSQLQPKPLGGKGWDDNSFRRVMSRGRLLYRYKIEELIFHDALTIHTGTHLLVQKPELAFANDASCVTL